MYYYFCALSPSALKLGGAYFGIVGDTVKACDIEKPTLIEFCPLSPFGKAVNFFCEEKYLLSPPPDVCVTDLKGGYMIKAMYDYSYGEFKILDKKNFGSVFVAVFFDKGIKISIETPNDFLIDGISLRVDNASIHSFNLGGKNFVAVNLTGQKNVLTVYDINEKICKVFENEITDFSCNNGLKTLIKHKDMAKHSVLTNWVLEGGVLKANSTVNVAKNFVPEALTEKLIPFAFFEELLVGGDCTAYLTESMQSKFSSLKGFLGDFIGVMPPPVFRNIDEVGLIYKKDKNLYYAEYYSAIMENGKITNIKRRK